MTQNLNIVGLPMPYRVTPLCQQACLSKDPQALKLCKCPEAEQHSDMFIGAQEATRQPPVPHFDSVSEALQYTASHLHDLAANIGEVKKAHAAMAESFKSSSDVMVSMDKHQLLFGGLIVALLCVLILIGVGLFVCVGRYGSRVPRPRDTDDRHNGDRQDPNNGADGIHNDGN